MTNQDYLGHRRGRLRTDHEAIGRLLIRQAVSRPAPDTGEIVLDFDATDSLIHGQQEGRFFHGTPAANWSPIFTCAVPRVCRRNPIL